MDKGYSPNLRKSHLKKLKIKEEVPKGNMKVTQPKKKAAPTPEKRSKILLPKGLTYQYDDEAIKNFYSNPGQSEVRLRHPTLIPNKEKKLYSLRLKLAVDVDEGQSVQVIGSIPELGIW